MKIPSSIIRLIESFERLPGIGPKTAQRLTFNLLNYPYDEIKKFSAALLELKDKTKLCSVCKNVSEEELCSVCSDDSRNQHLISVVTNPLDAFALEKTGFKGVYHVLHGIIDPLNNVGPEEIFLNDLVTRVEKYANQGTEVEVILALNSSMEGESTCMYISKMIKDKIFTQHLVKITRIARGLPVGGDIEYADDITLSRALEGRISY